MLLIGGPGSGKGTQGTRLAEIYRVEHVAAGDLLRAEIAAQTDLGRQVSDLVTRGELVPDQLVLDLVVPRLLAAAAAGGFIVDGFPRSAGQAAAARRITEEHNIAAQVAVNIVVERDDLIARLLHRARIEGRPDDTIDVISDRLDVFDRTVAPLLEFYGERGLLVTVHGSGPPEDVTAQIVHAVGQAME